MAKRGSGGPARGLREVPGGPKNRLWTSLLSLSTLCPEFSPFSKFRGTNGPLRFGGPQSPQRHSKEAPEVLPYLASQAYLVQMPKSCQKWLSAAKWRETPDIHLLKGSGPDSKTLLKLSKQFCLTFFNFYSTEKGQKRHSKKQLSIFLVKQT